MSRGRWLLRTFGKPLLILAVSILVGVIIVGLVGAVDWADVWDALRRLAIWQVVVLLLALLVRQTFNAVPLTQFVPGLSLWRSVQNDLGAVVVGTLAPPPADVVLRVSMFRSWGIDPVDGMAGVTLNMLAFYVVRFIAPALGLIALSVHGFETGQLVTALGSAAIAAAILVGLLLVVRGDGLARVLGRTAALVVHRFRSSVEPDSWAASVVKFRGRMAGNVRAGLTRSLLALLLMVLADATILTLSLRFVGLGASQLTLDQIVGTFLIAYPLTLLPLAGFGVLDAALIAAFTELCGLAHEPEVVAAIVVWRAVTILGPLLLGGITVFIWRRSAAHAGAVRRRLSLPSAGRGCSEGGHRREGPVRTHGGSRGGRRAPARAVVPTVDPHRVQPDRLGGHVVVEQALGHVQQAVRGDAEVDDCRGERLEVPRRRLVRPDVLRGDDAVERHAQPLVAAREAGPVDVRHDDQPVALGERGQRSRRVRERGPVRDRPTEPVGPGVGHRRAQLVAEPAEARRQHVRVQRARLGRLGVRLLVGVAGQQRLVVQLQPVLTRPRRQHRGDAGLPVDERAVAVERECLEVGDLHGAQPTGRWRRLGR